jgi:hypothetical protein
VAGTVITLSGPPPTPVSAIIARLTGDAPADAVLRTAAQLAVAYGVELVVDAGARLPRGVASVIRELRDHGLVVREESVEIGSGATLVVAGDTSADVVVRTGADGIGETPAQWVPRLHQEATQVTRG